MVRYRAADDDARRHRGRIHVGRFEADLAVVDQEGIAWADVAREAFVGGPTDLLVARNVFDGDLESVAGCEVDRAVGEGLKADLGALDIGEDGDVLAEVFGGTSHVVIVLDVDVMVAMAHVQAGDVESCGDCLRDFVVAGKGGS